MRAAVPPLASFEEPIVTWVTINAVTAIAKAIGTAKARTRERVTGEPTPGSCSDGVGAPVAMAATQPPSSAMAGSCQSTSTTPQTTNATAAPAAHDDSTSRRRKAAPTAPMAPTSRTTAMMPPSVPMVRTVSGSNPTTESTGRLDAWNALGPVPVTTEDPQARAEADQASV